MKKTRIVLLARTMYELMRRNRRHGCISVKNTAERVNNRHHARITHPWGLAMLVFVMLLSATGESLAQPVDILTFAYPPYMNGDGTGMVEKIVTAALQEHQHPVTFSVYPLKRAIHNFKLGEGQLFVGLPAYFSDREIEATDILYYRRVLVYLKEQYPTLDITSLEDLKGKTVGVLLGASVAPTLEAAGLIVETAPGNENNIKKLYARRVDFVGMIDVAAISQINATFPGQLADVGFFEFDRIALTLIVRKNSPATTLVQDFRTGLKTIIENGTYHHILEEIYGPGQVPASVPIDDLK